MLVDYLGKFENLSYSFSFICDRLSIYDGELPHSNKTITYVSDYVTCYDPPAVEAIGSKYAKDVSIFDYEFGV